MVIVVKRFIQFVLKVHFELNPENVLMLLNINNFVKVPVVRLVLMPVLTSNLEFATAKLNPWMKPVMWIAEEVVPKFSTSFAQTRFPDLNHF